MERDGFPIEETPTNVRHIAALRAFETLVKGITLNTNLYTNKETEQRSEDSELLPKMADSELDEESKDLSSSYDGGPSRQQSNVY